MDPIAPNTTLSSVPPGAATTAIEKPRRERAVVVRQKVKDLRTKVEDFARREPVKAMLIALAAGLVVGRLLHALGSMRKKKQRPVERIIIREPRDFAEVTA